MERREYLISDLAAAAAEKDAFSEVTSADRWELFSYETAEVSGRGIIASPRTTPGPITLDPKLAGWYRIYVSMASEDGMNAVELKLSKDEFSRVASPGKVDRFISWNSFEVAEESFWKAADMTGQTLTVAKPEKHFSYTACLLWLRFVPMTDGEVTLLRKETETAPRTMYAHMDEDFTWMDQLDPENLRDYCRPIWHMKHSDVGIFAQEVSSDLCDRTGSLDPASVVTRRNRGDEVFASVRIERARNLFRKREAILKEEIAYAHACRMQFFAVHRISLSNFGFPYGGEASRIAFKDEHPEFSCLARDGRRLSFLSFAFPEVQDYMIDQFRKYARIGVDGVTLILTRGIWIAFEKPVTDLFAQKYGEGIDPRRLPADDPRLYGVKCELMTGFIRRLRGALDALRGTGDGRVRIYLAVYCTAEAIRNDGIDVEGLAAEGLIDGVIQSNMTVWEETDDVLAEDGLIDLEKYEKKAETSFVIRRSHYNETERIVKGLATFRRIASDYGIRVYSELQWENTVEPEAFAEAARLFYENGADRLALWDAYPMRVARLPEWYVTSRLGSREHAASLAEDRDRYRRIHKILSYNGEDFRYCNPSWRG